MNAALRAHRPDANEDTPAEPTFKEYPSDTGNVVIEAQLGKEKIVRVIQTYGNPFDTTMYREVLVRELRGEPPANTYHPNGKPDYPVEETLPVRQYPDRGNTAF